MLREHRGTARPGDHEQVRETGRGDAEVGRAAPPPTSLSSAQPPRPRMSMAKSGPVMASKPVAKTMLSSAYSASRVRRPVGVIASIG